MSREALDVIFTACLLRPYSIPSFETRKTADAPICCFYLRRSDAASFRQTAVGQLAFFLERRLLPRGQGEVTRRYPRNTLLKSSARSQASSAFSTSTQGSNPFQTYVERSCNAANLCPLYHSDETGHILPHGGRLVDLMVRDSRLRADMAASATHKHECSERNACDVELLSVGGFSPLTGFMNRDVYDNVVDNMRWVGAA